MSEFVKVGEHILAKTSGCNCNLLPNKAYMSDKVITDIKKEIEWYKELLSNAIDENNPISARLYVKRIKHLDKELYEAKQIMYDLSKSESD